MAAYGTFGSFAITVMIDEEVVAVLPKTLKYICHNGMILHFGEEALEADS